MDTRRRLYHGATSIMAIAIVMVFGGNSVLAEHFGGKEPGTYYSDKIYEEYGEYYFFEFDGRLYSIRSDKLQVEPAEAIAQIARSGEGQTKFGASLSEAAAAIQAKNRDYYWSLAGVCAPAH